MIIEEKRAAATAGGGQLHLSIDVARGDPRAGSPGERRADQSCFVIGPSAQVNRKVASVSCGDPRVCFLHKFLAFR
jgi:hypothetical protein